MFGYKCQCCEGPIWPKIVALESFKRKAGFVILQDVMVGVCDVCGNCYYSVDALYTVHFATTPLIAAPRI